MRKKKYNMKWKEEEEREQKIFQPFGLSWNMIRWRIDERGESGPSIRHLTLITLILLMKV